MLTLDTGWRVCEECGWFNSLVNGIRRLSEFLHRDRNLDLAARTHTCTFLCKVTPKACNMHSSAFC